MNPNNTSVNTENTTDAANNLPSSINNVTIYTKTDIKSRKWFKLWLVIAIIILGSAAYSAYRINQSTKSGDLFDTALENALQTNSITQTNTLGVSNLTIKYDVSNPRDAKVQSSGKLVQGKSITAFNGYGTFKNSFIKFTTLIVDDQSVPQVALDKWFQVRQDGSDNSRGYFAKLFQNDPNSAFFGDLIFGNFSSKERKELLDYIHQHNIYVYDKSAIQHQQYKGKPVSVYTVTENKKELANYNKIVGKMIGLPTAQLNETLRNQQYAGTAKVYVSESTKQFVHVQAGNNALDYYDYGTTDLIAAPKPQTTFEQFEEWVVRPQQ